MASPGAGGTRTYSLLSNRFPITPSSTSASRIKSTGAVYSTYPIGRAIAYDEPQIELDRSNQLHVLHCAAPRTWAYSRVGLNGELRRALHDSWKQRHVRVSAAPDDGAVAVRGGMLEAPASQSPQSPASKLSARPPATPDDE